MVQWERPILSQILYQNKIRAQDLTFKVRTPSKRKVLYDAYNRARYGRC